MPARLAPLPAPQDGVHLLRLAKLGGTAINPLAPIGEGVFCFARFHARLARQLRDAGVRAEADLGSDRMNAKIRAAQLMKVPCMLVVGDRETVDETVSLRRRDGSRQNGMAVAVFQCLVTGRIASRSGEL